MSNDNGRVGKRCAPVTRPSLFDGQAFGLEVRLGMARANLSLRQLAALVGIDQANIHRVAKHGKPPCIETYLRLRAWLDRDSDGSPEGRDAKRLDGKAATARAEGIAQ